MTARTTANISPLRRFAVSPFPSLVAFTPFVLLVLIAGCQENPLPPMAITMTRGQQLLGAGSPKSAIPFLTQTVAATPDGPEPVAMLALAYALDLQDQRALMQARQVRRPAGACPGWEAVAVGIAQMTQHKPAQAVQALQRVATDATPGCPLQIAGRQWLSLALIQQSDNNRAAESLQALARCPHMFSTALSWMAILYAQQGYADASAQAVVQCAKAGATDAGRRALKAGLADADDQSLYDAAIAALSDNDFATAQRLFETVSRNNPDGSDAPVWLALIASAKQDWQTGSRLLKTAAASGCQESRGLASHLLCVVYAIQDRPDDLIESLLAGQRLLGRAGNPNYIVEQPQPEPVWGADYMK